MACELVQQNRDQFQGEKNCCQRRTTVQEKDDQRFTKTKTHGHESALEVARQSEAKRNLAPQIDANVSQKSTGHPKIRNGVFLRRTQLILIVTFNYDN